MHNNNNDDFFNYFNLFINTTDKQSDIIYKIQLNGGSNTTLAINTLLDINNNVKNLIQLYLLNNGSNNENRNNDRNNNMNNNRNNYMDNNRNNNRNNNNRNNNNRNNRNNNRNNRPFFNFSIPRNSTFIPTSFNRPMNNNRLFRNRHFLPRTRHVQTQIPNNFAANLSTVPVINRNMINILNNTFDNQDEHVEIGLNDQQINDLTTTYRYIKIDNIDDISPISRTIIQDGQMVTKINKCNHIFIENNIKTWLSNHHTCPVCRCNLLNDNTDISNNTNVHNDDVPNNINNNDNIHINEDVSRNLNLSNDTINSMFDNITDNFVNLIRNNTDLSNNIVLDFDYTLRMP